MTHYHRDETKLDKVASLMKHNKATAKRDYCLLDQNRDNIEAFEYIQECTRNDKALMEGGVLSSQLQDDGRKTRSLLNDSEAGNAMKQNMETENATAAVEESSIAGDETDTLLPHAS